MTGRPKQFAGGALPQAGSGGELRADRLDSAQAPKRIVIRSPQDCDRGQLVVQAHGKAADLGPSSTTNCVSLPAVTPSSVSTGVPVPRRRFQRGSLVEKS